MLGTTPLDFSSYMSSPKGSLMVWFPQRVRERLPMDDGLPLKADVLGPMPLQYCCRRSFPGPKAELEFATTIKHCHGSAL